MRITVDPEADTLYVRLDQSHVVEVVGFEMLRVGERPSTAELKRLEFEVL